MPVELKTLPVGARFRFIGEEQVYTVCEQNGGRAIIQAELGWTINPQQTVRDTEMVVPINA